LPSSGIGLPSLPLALVCQPSRFLPLKMSLNPDSGLNSSAAITRVAVAHTRSAQVKRRMERHLKGVGKWGGTVSESFCVPSLFERGEVRGGVLAFRRAERACPQSRVGSVLHGFGQKHFTRFWMHAK